MKTRFLVLLLFMFAAAFITLRMAAAEDDASSASAVSEGVPPGDFHAAQTDAEMSLDKLLLSDKDEEGGLLHKPAGDVPPEDGVAASPFTQQFLHSLKEKGKQLKRNSGGKDKYYALVSGILTCGTGYSNNYNQLFHTIEENDQNAIIMSVRREAINTDKLLNGSIYKLVKEGENWELDGIVCKNTDFNTAK